MRRAWTIGVAATLTLSACGGGSDRPAECEAIVEACHPLDPGSGPIHECHEFAEDEQTTKEECIAMQDNCLATCMPLANTLYVANEGSLVSYDIASGQERPGAVRSVTGPVDMQSLEDGTIMVNLTGRVTISRRSGTAPSAPTSSWAIPSAWARRLDFDSPPLSRARRSLYRA